MTQPQDHPNNPIVNIVLVSCSTHHPLQFDVPHVHVRNNKYFDPLGHDQGERENKNPARFVLYFFICAGTHLDWYKHI